MRISIRYMPEGLWKRVRHLAIERSVAVHQIVIWALERYMKTEEE